MTYAKDRAWSDQFLPHIKAIVGPHLLVESSPEVDRQQASDLVVMHAGALAIACRVRRAGYAMNFRYDFTIRSSRASGAKTELAKIMDGWGDWMFYGHQAKADQLGLWYLIDLNVFRKHVVNMQLDEIVNRGFNTSFVAFDVRRFPASLLIDYSYRRAEAEKAEQAREQMASEWRRVFGEDTQVDWCDKRT